MNRIVVHFHLSEAAEQLNEMVRRLGGTGKYTPEEFEVEMGHIYHHLNTAWNGQNQTDAQFKKCSEKDFAKFRKFPQEDEFTYLKNLEKI